MFVMRREKCNVSVVFRHIAKMYPRDQAALFSSFIFFSLLPVISLRTFGPCCLPPSLPSFLNCLWPHSLTTTPSLCSTTTTTTPPKTPSALCFLLFQLLVIMQVPDWLTSPAAG